jgi:hypothetical protein
VCVSADRLGPHSQGGEGESLEQRAFLFIGLLLARIRCLLSLCRHTQYARSGQETNGAVDGKLKLHFL